DEPGPAGVHHHRDHGDRGRRRGAVQVTPQRHPGRHSRRHHPRGELYVTVTVAATDLKVGRIVAIVGPVVDVEFPPGNLPELQGALELTVGVAGQKTVITAEVAQHIGYSRVRAICLKPTDGLVRGTEVR